jgi:hypothetical protein
MKTKDDFLIAHVEVAKARFSNGVNLGVEFTNEIDAWAKMEAHFCHQIRNPRKRLSRGKQDLKPLIYSVRHKIDS